MSVFAQYVPHTFATGSWDDHRERVRKLAFNSIGRFCSNLPDAVLDAQVMGPGHRGKSRIDRRSHFSR